MEGDLQILSMMKTRIVIFVSFKNIKYNREERKRDLTSQAIVETRSDRRSRVMYGLRYRPSDEST